ncbi:putative deoxyribonuclease TATDN2 [Dreissena polymorpha]|nr:putative deoxyribonuclease TATDN2 [Dreissena polymorpha]
MTVEPVEKSVPKVAPLRSGYKTWDPGTKGFGAAVGIHSKKVQFEELRSLLMLKAVVALGEIGLDRCSSAPTWKLQEDILVKVLQLSMPIRPVILHMRDAADQQCGEIGARCLQIMTANVSPTQRIHLHCFTRTVDQVVSWLETFPKCYFGATGLVREFDSFQNAALRRIPKGHSLPETDAPFFRPLQASANISAFIGEVALEVSRVRGETLEEGFDFTSANARILYQM